METNHKLLKVNVNSASLIFIGLIPYDKNKLQADEFKYKTHNFYEENKDHFDQKYYTNYINSIFLNNEFTDKNGSHFIFDKQRENDLFEIKEVSIVKTKFQFQVKEIEVIIFSESLAMSLLRIDLLNPNIETIGLFTNYARKTLSTKKYPHESFFLDIMTDKVAGTFCNDNQKWKSYNPHLKVASFVDIYNKLEDKDFNKLLYSIGAFYNVNDDDKLYEPSDDYLETKIDKNTIDIYKNWKTIVLQDSLTRISINLNKRDTHKLWETEYIYIYMYVLFSKFFLQEANEDLLKISLKKLKIKSYRKKFLDIVNEYDLAKISYKFLENEIYEKIRTVLKIENESNKLESRISRQNILYNESYQGLVNTILLTLTIFTIISTIYDAGQLSGDLFNALSIQSLYLIAFIFVIIVVALASIIYILLNKK